MGKMLAQLKGRERLLSELRNFLSSKGITEVTVPILCDYALPDPGIEHVKTCDNRYLLPSQEQEMKKILALGSGHIYSLQHCYRKNELGRYHSEEFAMLEVYLVGRGLAELEDLTLELIAIFVPEVKATGPKRLDFAHLAEKINQSADDFDSRLATQILPNLGQDGLALVERFPATRAGFAALAADGHTARRFEIYCKGLELANGSEEIVTLRDFENRCRELNLKRRNQKLPATQVDPELVRAYAGGMPAASGVALGLDRLIMLGLGLENLTQAQCRA